MSILKGTTINTQDKRRVCAIVALSLSLFVGLNLVPAYAQGASGETQSLGLDQDSLLPPEVIPLDPAMATKMTQVQAQSRAAQMSAAPAQQPAVTSNATPGLGGAEPLTPPANMQSAQDFKKAMFDYASSQSPVQRPTSLQNMQAGQQQQFGQPMGQPGLGQPGMGQPGMGQPGLGQLPGTTNQIGQSQMLSPTAPPQTQMLAGGAQTQAGKSKLTGIKHGIGVATMLGSGILIGGMAMRSGNPMAGLGMGLFGANLINTGLRSGLSNW